MKAKINEIFKSIQGEGLYFGYPQIFIRFFGCNLVCGYCDTKLVSFKEMTVGEILSIIKEYKDYHSISLTGGEPLLQHEFVKELAWQLRRQGIKIYLETNGTLPQALKNVIGYIDFVALDFKLPSATGLDECWQAHRESLFLANRKKVFVKMVVGLTTHISDVLKAIGIVQEVNPDIYLVIQPQHPHEQELIGKVSLFETICEQNKMKVKVIPQMHKHLGVK